MPQPFLGEVRLFAGNFAPVGWAFCNGQLLPIASNTALFSLLGIRFGGNGVSTFALPDFRGRVPLHAGQGPGLSPRNLGEAGGSEAHGVTSSEMPVHTHAVGASSGNGTSDDPAGRVLARDPSATPQFANTPDALEAAAAVGSSGGGQPHNNMAPYLAVTFIIATQGVYPSRA